MNYIFAQLIKKSSVPNVDASGTTLQHVLNIIFATSGAVAFLMLVIAGLRYVLSDGEPTKTVEIRRQIIYILVGIVVIASAATVVNFVMSGVH